MADKKDQKITIVYYINQFFGRIGGEESANVGLTVQSGAIGPAMAVKEFLGERGEVLATIICGDNYFIENENKVKEEIIQLVKQYSPKLVLAGPAFNAGRYGVACGEICKTIQDELGIPAVTAMYKENPGVELYRKHVAIVKTANNARAMKTAISQMIQIGEKLLQNEILDPEEDNYFSKGVKRNYISDKTAAERAVEMLVNKITGKEYRSEIRLPEFESVPEPPPVKDLKNSIIALTTDGGLYPKGNPDKVESAGATKYGKYSIEGIEKLNSTEYEVCHRGYDNSCINEDPNRLVPVDVMSDFVKEGLIGSLYPYYFSTTGVMTNLENSRKIGKQIAHELSKGGVDAVIHTST